MFLDFCNNEDVRRVFVTNNHTYLSVSSTAPSQLGKKTMVFVKCTHATKLTKETMNRDVMCMDCGANPLKHLHYLTKEILLPLHFAEDQRNENGEKLTEIMHKLLESVETMEGRAEVRN